MKSRKKRLNCSLVAIVILGGLLFSGCRTNVKMHPTARLQHTENFTVQGASFTGVQLLKSNGKIFAGYFRAKHGLVVCSHFDIKAMNQGKIPAAMAPHWGTNSLKQEIEEKIIKVNALAAEKGVKVGMSVREALVLLNQ